MNKLLTRLGVAGALTAAAVWVVKNQTQIAETAIRGAVKAKELTDKGVALTVTLVDGLLTKANDWLTEPEKPKDPETQKPADEYTHSKPLLDDEQRSA